MTKLSKAQTNPKEVFLSLFDKRMFAPEVLEKAYLDVMDGKLGIHMRFVGDFWNVQGIEKTLNAFCDFATTHNVPVKTTWEPEYIDGFGVQFFCAEIKDCHKL